MSINTFRNQRVKLRFSRAYGNSSPLAVPVEQHREGIKITRRGVFLFFKTVFALAFVAGLGFGAHHVCKHHIWGGDRFTVKEIRISTDGEMTRPEILAKAGLQEGVRIFDVNLSEARKGLEEASQIETVEVERFLPSTVVVRFTERKPVSWVLEGAETDPGLRDPSGDPLVDVERVHRSVPAPGDRPFQGVLYGGDRSDAHEIHLRVRPIG